MAEQEQPHEENLTERGNSDFRQQQDEGLGRFQNQQMVNVERNSGDMEDNWGILGYNKDEDKIVVVQQGTGTRKLVTRQKLEEWNPEQ